MVVIRDIFQVKFGLAKQATELWKQALAELRSAKPGPSTSRLLTDLAGPPFYTLIMESTFDSLSQWEQFHQSARTNASWRELYQKIVPLAEGGRREILTVVA